MFEMRKLQEIVFENGKYVGILSSHRHFGRDRAANSQISDLNVRRKFAKTVQNVVARRTSSVFARKCFTCPPGGTQVDGLPPATSADKFVHFRYLCLKCENFRQSFSKMRNTVAYVHVFDILVPTDLQIDKYLIRTRDVQFAKNVHFCVARNMLIFRAGVLYVPSGGYQVDGLPPATSCLRACLLIISKLAW